MSFEIRITLTEEEYLAACTEMASCQEWTENAIRVRANIAKTNIIQKYVSEAVQHGWSIPTNSLDIIKEAYSKGLVQPTTPLTSETNVQDAVLSESVSTSTPI